MGLASPGRVPKHPSLRARTNKVPGGEHFYDPAPVKPPRMPASPPGGWHPRTKAAWASVMSGGWTALMRSEDWASAELWARMHHRLMLGLDLQTTGSATLKGLSSEVRALLESFGGTEPARLRRHWFAGEPVKPGRRLASVSTMASGLRMDDLPEVPDGE